ncbi:hypothetical protein HDU97_001632 [Phlyctochytrium planicorne]|nr:hypothetical protein HDU97_001632 [Phlyctochytrium planicorne]
MKPSSILRLILTITLPLIVHSAPKRLRFEPKPQSDAISIEDLPPAPVSLTSIFDAEQLVDAAPTPQTTIATCPKASNFVKSPFPNVFKEFEVPEIRQLKNWLFAQKELGLVPIDKADLKDNYVFKVDRKLPKKGEAVAFLEKKGPKPLQYAHVIINFGTKEQIREYTVGPLPPTNVTKATLIRTLPYNARFLDDKEYEYMYDLVANTVGNPLADAHVSQELFGGEYRNNDNDTITWIDVSPHSFDGSKRRTWSYWVSQKDGLYIRPVGLQTLFDHSGPDPSKWKLVMIVYENQVFKTAAEFIKAYKSKSLKITNRYKEEDEWSNMKSSGPTRQFDNREGPRSTEFAGKRYVVDPKERYVHWMGWSFYIRFSRDTGVGLYDVRFKGERIAYEITLSEALAQYSGSNPVQANTAYLDSHFGIGSSMYELLDGYDCPKGSTYFDLDYYDGAAKTNLNNVCVFEVDSNLPLGRHWGDDGTGNYQWFGVNKGFNFHVRTIAAVYNYDYIFDYVFWLDGTIEIKVAASGYMQGAWWTPDDERDFGGRIHTFAMGSLHDHIINFKIDLDIAGPKNSFETISIQLEKSNDDTAKKYDWILPDQDLVQKKLIHNIPKTEFGLQTISANDFGTSWKFINQDKKNKWGNSKGYRIIAANPIRNIVDGNTGSLKNAQWSKYFIAVTQRKDEEQTGSDIYNQHLPLKPPVEFDKFINGESIVQEDLVAWVNLGNHHIPRAEDAPVTLTSSSRSSIILTPFNYFDEMASRDLKNSAYVTAAEKKTSPASVNTYGVKEANCYAPPVAVPYKGLPQTYKGV